MKTTCRKLTKKERLFVAELPKDWVGSQAVIRAGYRVKDNQSAAEIACQLLNKTQVKKAVDIAMEQQLQEIGITTKRILEETAKVAFSDVRALYREDGTLRPTGEWPDSVAGAVSGVDVSELFEGRGENRQEIGYLKKVRTYDKVKALDILAKHLKLYPEAKSEVDVNLKGDVTLTNLELSAKIIYLIHAAIEKKKELEAKAAEPKPEGKRTEEKFS